MSDRILDVGFVLVGELGSHHRECCIVHKISTFDVSVELGSLIEISNKRVEIW